MHRRLFVAAFAAVALAAVALAAVALAAAAVPVASAVEPTRVQLEDQGSPEDPGICPFPVEYNWRSFNDEVSFYDQSGNRVRITYHFRMQTWFSANGKTFVSDWRVLSRTIVEPDNPEGAVFDIWRANAERFRLPDGTVWITGPCYIDTPD
jgi:hypothetical protein